jgi:hypothetical protein
MVGGPCPLAFGKRPFPSAGWLVQKRGASQNSRRNSFVDCWVKLPFADLVILASHGVRAVEKAGCVCTRRAAMDGTFQQCDATGLAGALV